MRLDNEFVVPRPVEQAWAVLTDVEKIAPCMPGAQLTEVVDDAYHGTVKVKVGPVVTKFAGVARFKELDTASHHAVLEASGRDTTGRGRASALVTADLVADGDSTRVRVGTELTIAGPLAQFGRGTIAEVSAKLLGQFVDRLKETVLVEEQPTATAPTLVEEQPAATPPTPSVPTPPEPAPPAPVPPAKAATPDAAASDAVASGTATSSAVASDAAATGTAAAQDAARSRTINAPEAAPADLLAVARWPVLKRLVPLLVLIVVVVVVLVVWLA